MLVMLRGWPAVVLLIVLTASGFAQQQTPTLLVDVDHRAAISLDGEWHFIVDPYRDGWGSHPGQPDLHGYAADAHPSPDGPLVQYDFAVSPMLKVPGSWNNQQKTLLYYEGLLWYERHFDFHPAQGERTFLHFGAVNYRADVFVNDHYVCHHEGGFTPFDCEVTGIVRNGDNTIVVAVDNTRHKDSVPTLKYDWWNYGGLTRDVSIVQVPEKFIDDYSLQLQRRDAANHPGWITGYVHVEGASADTKVRVEIPGLKAEQVAETDADGRAAFAFDPHDLQRWSPHDPKLYRVEMSAGSDRLEDEIGFRTVAVRGDRILLNGKPIFLRGIDVQGQAPYRDGPSWSEQDVSTLLNWAVELHCNFLRLVHYPHDERMIRLADRKGILLWSEIPVYWSIDWTNPQTLAIAKQQLHAMIRRDDNRASVILWSLSNETPPSPARDAFLEQLAKAARQQDPTRLITSAIVTPFHGKQAVLDDPLDKYLDVLGYNEYIGWYMGTPESAPSYTWHDPLGKPVIISEFGASAKAGLHGSASTRFTEEYQAKVYREQFKMFAKMPFLAGISPWLLMDFRSPMRVLPGMQDGFNRKGLVSDQGQKKQSFAVLQQYYETLQQHPACGTTEPLDACSQ